MSDKYYGFEDSGTHNGYEAWELFVSRYPDDKEMVWFRCYGNINLYISKYTDTYPTTYTLHIDYTDQINDVLEFKEPLRDVDFNRFATGQNLKPRQAYLEELRRKAKQDDL